jgi:hypothetical protein
MKLIDKFKQWLDTQPREQIREVQLEVIADEFAIGFGEWICEKAEIPYIKGKMDSTLEIYKKEKGL